jgi:RluA family pseudouridine synthase
MQSIKIPQSQTGKTIERFLARNFPIGYVRKLFRKRGVRLNGKRARAQDILHAGDLIELFLLFEPEPHRPASTVTDRHLQVLYQNNDVLVLNKPPGIAVHEAKSITREQTVLGRLEARYRDAPFTPRLVHRLDKDTSGLLLVAKNDATAADLESQFESARIDKEYVCLVVGQPIRSSGTIDSPLPGRDGKPARAMTHYRIVERFVDTSLLRVTIETGRMHQIRLHLAQLGHPVVLDSRHGDFKFNRSFRKATGLKRQFLHAARMRLTYKGERFVWTAPLPNDLQRTLHALAGERVPFNVQKFKVSRAEYSSKLPKR